MIQSRRDLLSAFGAALPIGLAARPASSAVAGQGPMSIRFQPFEEAVRAAFAGHDPSQGADPNGDPQAVGGCRRIEVGDSELVRSGLQGCHNDRPFAGFPAGSLRIVRAGSGPGPTIRGMRLYVSTVEVVLDRSSPPLPQSRPLDFAAVPPAPTA